MSSTVRSPFRCRGGLGGSRKQAADRDPASRAVAPGCVRPAPPDADRVRARLPATVDITDDRTLQQDFDFGLRRLLDIALRALSPAVNDPTTAVEVVLRLGSPMRRVLVAPVPGVAVRGDEGRVPVRPWLLSAEEYIEHALDEIRHVCADQVHVAIALVRVLRMLTEHVRDAGRPEHVPVLERQIRMVLDAVTARTDLHPDDLARLQEVARSSVDPAEHRPDRRNPNTSPCKRVWPLASRARSAGSRARSGAAGSELQPAAPPYFSSSGFAPSTSRSSSSATSSGSRRVDGSPGVAASANISSTSSSVICDGSGGTS